MSECLFPNCKRHAEKNGYCIGHHAYASGVSVTPKKEVNKVGDKQKDIKKALKEAYPVFLAKHPKCEINSPNCTKKATCVHHKKGRGINEVLDQSIWAASCEPCNLWCETNHAEAEARGMKISRHQKANK